VNCCGFVLLPNPVVVPAYANPVVWVIAFVAMWAEIRTECAMLRRWGWGKDVLGTLLLVNLLTWLSFLVAMDRLEGEDLSPVWTVSFLEAGVVAVEAALTWAALKSRARAARGRAISWRGAFGVSFVGNQVSVLISITLEMGFAWLFVG
jgi:hypothetical protein